MSRQALEPNQLAVKRVQEILSQLKGWGGDTFRLVGSTIFREHLLLAVLNVILPKIVESIIHTFVRTHSMLA